MVNKTGAQLLYGVSAGGMTCLLASLSLLGIQKMALYEPALLLDGTAHTSWLPRFDQEIAEGKVAAALVTSMKGLERGGPVMNAMPNWLLESLTNAAMKGEDKQAGPDDITMRKLAPTLHWAMQGLGTGIGIGLVAAVIGDLFPPEQRASKQGLIGIVFGVSQLCGPTLGGWITDHGPLLSGFVTETTRWLWLFYLNLPVGLLALIVLGFFLPARPAEQTTRRAALARIDWFGAILLVAATCSLLLGLSLGSEQGRAWTSWPVIVLLTASALFYALFLGIEHKATEPVLPLALLLRPIFAVDALQTLIQGMILIGIFIPLSLFLQGVLALSPTGTGALLTALSVSLTLGAALAGISISLRKRYQLTAIVGAAIMTLGLLLLTLLAQHGNLLLLGLALVLVGLGVGSFFTIQMVAAQNAIPQAQLWVGSGVIRYLAQLGMTLGAALMGVVVNGAAATTRSALSGVLQHGFWVVLALSVLLLLSTFLLKDVPSTQSLAKEVK